MQVTDPRLLSYLHHRLGKHQIESWKPRVGLPARLRIGPGGKITFYHITGLDSNTPTPNFSETFGRSTISAYVGFVDLAGFSTSVHGKAPDEIAEYLTPFLNGLVGIIRNFGALIDKTIGDEVMFVLPEIEEEEVHREIKLLRGLMADLCALAFGMDGRYRFRIGLSYGKVRFFCIEGPGYSEWTAVGETVHVAKRLHSLPELEEPDPVIGAFGMQTAQESIEDVRRVMEQRLSIVAGLDSPFDHRVTDKPLSLKGVGDVLYAILRPRPQPAPSKAT